MRDTRCAVGHNSHDNSHALAVLHVAPLFALHVLTSDHQQQPTRCPLSFVTPAIVSASSDMRRPGHLQPYPLEQFLIHESRQQQQLQKGGKGVAKRPRSPGLNLYSPTKRRILTEEGLFSPSKKNVSLPRLDLGAAEGSKTQSSSSNSISMANGDATPKSRSFRKLSPQAEVTTASGEPSRLRETQAKLDVFANPSAVSTPRRSAPLYAPREMPPRADPQSEHYPGFDVYQDTHILVPTRIDLDAAIAEVARFDKEDTKENIPVKKLKAAQKALLAATVKDVPSPFLSPSHRSKSLKTPRVVVSPPAPSRAAFGTTPLKSAIGFSAVSELTKADMKKLMEAEAEGAFLGESDSELDC